MSLKTQQKYKCIPAKNGLDETAAKQNEKKLAKI